MIVGSDYDEVAFFGTYISWYSGDISLCRTYDKEKKKAEPNLHKTCGLSTSFLVKHRVYFDCCM